jgi:hypothetical protein
VLDTLAPALPLTPLDPFAPALPLVPALAMLSVPLDPPVPVVPFVVTAPFRPARLPTPAALMPPATATLLPATPGPSEPEAPVNALEFLLFVQPGTSQVANATPIQSTKGERMDMRPPREAPASPPNRYR